MVTASTGIKTDLLQVIHPSCTPVCHSSELQTSTVCISSPGPTCSGHICTKHKLVRSCCLCLPSLSSPSHGDPKISQYYCLISLIIPGWSGMSLFFGPSAVNGDSILVTTANNTSQTVPQPSVSLKSTTSEPPCLVSRNGQLQEQSFSVEVKERLASPQRSSTRTIYKSKRALFEKWYRETKKKLNITSW